jgi:hypothetical protein
MNPVAISHIRAIRDDLLAKHPELADDTDLFADMIEGETDAHAIMARLVRHRAECVANGAACDALATEYANKADLWCARADAHRKTMRVILEAAGLSKIVTPGGTVSLRPGSVSLALDDDFKPPQGYARTTIAPDRGAIKKALQEGETMPGARLVTGETTVMVR